MSETHTNIYLPHSHYGNKGRKKNQCFELIGFLFKFETVNGIDSVTFFSQMCYILVMETVFLNYFNAPTKQERYSKLESEVLVCAKDSWKGFVLLLFLAKPSSLHFGLQQRSVCSAQSSPEFDH